MRNVLKSILIVFASGMAAAFLFRLLFFIFFRTPVQDEYWWSSLAFIHGQRFDFSSLCALNLIFILLVYFRPIRQNRFFLHLWTFVNFLYCGLLVGDFIHYSIYNTRLTWDVLGLFHGMNFKIVFLMVSQFLMVIPILIVCYIACRYLIFKQFAKNNDEFKLVYYPIYFLLVALVFVIGYRGGFQKRVLAVQHSWLYADGNSFFAAMTTNTLHNLLREGKSAKLPFDKKKLKQALLPTWDAQKFIHKPLLGHAPKNVMFVFFESLASYPYDQNYMPKLKNWVKEHNKDLFFNTNFYANGKLSKDSLLSIFFGLPSYFDVHVFESKYSKNTFAGIGQVAEQMGQTSFYMDAATGGMQFFDVIVKAAGFDSYMSIQDKYKKVKVPRNGWGVHDEVLYKDALEYANQLKKPFFGAVFTVSSHTPFFGAPNRPQYKDEAKDYLAAVNYGDESLVGFFEEASKTDWYKDTLFIVTGDHSPPLSAKWNRDLHEMSRVPFLMYWPGSNLNAVTFKEIGRHVDIPHTLFHVLGRYPERWTAYGESMVKTEEDPDSNVFYTTTGAVNLVLDPSHVVTQPLFDIEKKVSENALKLKKFSSKLIKKISKNPSRELKEEIDETLKAQRLEFAEKELRDYIFRLENNSLYK